MVFVLEILVTLASFIAALASVEKLFVLSEGRTAYFGPANGIPVHFGMLGYTFPVGVSISEYALNVVNREFSADPAQVDAILDARTCT